MPESVDFVVATVWGETEAMLCAGLLLLLLRLLFPGAGRLSLPAILLSSIVDVGK